MGFLESRILYFSVVLLNLSFSYLSRPFQCHIQQENEVSLQTRGFPSRPEDLDCSPYIKSLSFEGFQPEVWSFLQKGKKKCMKCWHTKNTEKQPTSNSLVSITDYQTPNGPQWLSETGRARATKELAGICLKLQERDEALSHLWRRILPLRGCYWHSVSCGKG